MKKLSLTSILMVCMSIAAIAVYAATTKIMVATSPGARAVNTIGVGKPVHIEAIGCLPADGTAVLYRITGNSTNQIVSAQLSGGKYNAAIAGTNYVAAGDTLLFAGTYTSGIVRVIFDAD